MSSERPDQTLSPSPRDKSADKSTVLPYPPEFTAVNRNYRGDAVGRLVSTMPLTFVGIAARLTWNVLDTSGRAKSPESDTSTVIWVIAEPHPALANERMMSGARWSVLTLAVNTGPGFGVANGTMFDSPATLKEFVARTRA